MFRSALVILLLTSQLCLSAPAPFEKRTRKTPSPVFPYPIGVWINYNKEVKMTFQSNGEYYENWYGVSYSGSWSHDINCVQVKCYGDITRIEFNLQFVKDDDNTMSLNNYGVLLTKEK